MATRADADRLLRFVLAEHEETQLAPTDEEKIRGCVQIATAPPGAQAFNLLPPRFGIIEGKRHIEAAFGIFPDEVWWSRAYVLRMFFFAVGQDYRRTSHGSTLIKAAKEYADQVGLALLADIQSLEKGSQAKIDMFGRHMRQIGGVFVYWPSEC